MPADSVYEVAMTSALPLVLVPGLACTARLYAEQIGGRVERSG